MTDLKTIERLETRLTHLIESQLTRKKDQIDYLLGLNRIDDLLVEHGRGHGVTEGVASFLAEYRPRLQSETMTAAQRRRLGDFLSELLQRLRDSNDGDSAKLADEVREWISSLGEGGFRLILKKPQEPAPLAERFQACLRWEMEEMTALAAVHDHLLSCLDDVLKSAEVKVDPTYRHLAASMIYFLQMEGYKVDPYLKRLRRIQTETEAS